LEYLHLGGSVIPLVLEHRLDDVLDIDFSPRVIRRAGNDEAVFNK
jgi:hypothetical protein